MKRSVLCGAVLLGAFLLLAQSQCFGQGARAPEQVGRYQVIQAEYEAYDGPNKPLRTTMIKVDTVTGRTWILEDFLSTIDPKTKTSHYTRTWKDVEEYWSVEYDADGKPKMRLLQQQKQQP